MKSKCIFNSLEQYMDFYLIFSSMNRLMIKFISFQRSISAKNSFISEKNSVKFRPQRTQTTVHWGLFTLMDFDARQS